MLNSESSRSNHNKIVNNIHALFIILGVGLAYYGVAEIYPAIAFIRKNATLVWPSGGIAVSAVLMLGNRSLFGALLGKLTNVSHFLQGTNLTFAIASAFGIVTISVTVIVSYWLSGFFRDRTLKNPHLCHWIREVAQEKAEVTNPAKNFFLINNFLNFSKIEAKRIPLNKDNFDLYRLLDDIREMFQPKAADKGLQLLMESAANLPRYIRADESKLRQILMNSIDNALKFTSTGGIYVISQRSSMDKIAFEVGDTGMGIPPEEIDQRFATSREFVRLMGGEIQVRSRKEQGTISSFEIHFENVEAPEVELAPTQENNLQELEVLTEENFQALPPELRIQLCRAILSASPWDMAVVLNAIQTKNADLAEAIAHCFHNSEYERILNLIP